MTMEMCKLCGEPVSIKSDSVNATIGDNRSGLIHERCRDKAIDKVIAAREAEKPKAVTLEENLRSYLIKTHAVCFAPSTIDGVIALVREHDGEMGKTAAINWKARAEKAEAKLAAIASELST